MSGQTLFLRPFPMMLTSLPAESTVSLPSPSLSRVGAVGRVGRYMRVLVDTRPVVGSPLALLLPSAQLKADPMLGRQGGGMGHGVPGDLNILCLTWQLC